MNDAQYNSIMTSMSKLIAKQNEMIALLNKEIDYLNKLSSKTLIIDQATQDLYRLKVQVQALVDEASM